MSFILVNRLWEEEETQDGSSRRQPKLKIEDDPPRGISDDDAANERTECWTDQGARQEPTHGCGTLSWTVHVANDCSSDDQECCAFEGGEHAEDEEGGEVW